VEKITIVAVYSKVTINLKHGKKIGK